MFGYIVPHQRRNIGWYYITNWVLQTGGMSGVRSVQEGNQSTAAVCGSEPAADEHSTAEDSMLPHCQSKRVSHYHIQYLLNHRSTSFALKGILIFVKYLDIDALLHTVQCKKVQMMNSLFLKVVSLALVAAPVFAQVTTNSDTFVQLFEWSWADVAAECEDYLAPKGFWGVQVSPPMEHITGSQWWTRFEYV